MKISQWFLLGYTRVMVTAVMVVTLHGADGPQDLTSGGVAGIDRTLTYNLGATGLRGWIYSKPVTHFDGLQGRTTAISRQILVTHVGSSSPADGVMQVDDVITGVKGKPFSDDARLSFALAIQEAEKEANKGILPLTRWRAGKCEEVRLTLRVLGSYSPTAPYDCPKSQRILAEACKVLEKEPLNNDLWGAINGLALMASGRAEYMPRIRDFAHQLAPATLKIGRTPGMVIWNWGYTNLFLCEYFLLTHDPEVLPGIREYTSAMARGQGVYGTFGHGLSDLTADGKLHGPVPSYGPMNEAGLIANLSIVLGKKCGVTDPEIDPAIERGSRFISYYMDKGSLPYGEHEPWAYHENNGKVSMAALLFALQGNRPEETRFFAKMAIAGYKNRECGHTGQGFSYLWSALGASVGGPAAAAAFVKEASWHLDLVRRSDGSFTYDGGEQYGPGKTQDNTYFGKSGYYGLNPTASYVLTYTLPLKKLFITGKAAPQVPWLKSTEVASALASARFDLDRLAMTPQQLVAAFSDWSPVVRGWAAETLSQRPEAAAMIPQLLTLAEGKDAHMSQGACETLGLLRSVEALPALVRLLSHDDRWVRYKAAQALGKMGAAAAPAIPGILAAIVATAEPLDPINWADPIQFAHGQLATLFSHKLGDALQKAEAKSLYPALRVLAKNPDGMARACLEGYFERRLSLEDVRALAPDLMVAVQTRCPADTMFADEIRLGAFKALTKYHFHEAINAGVVFAKTQTGWHSESRTGAIMALIVGYGSAARSAIPGLKEVIVALDEQVKRGEFPGGDLNARRVNAVKEAIAAIEAAQTQPELRRIAPLPPAGP